MENKQAGNVSEFTPAIQPSGGVMGTQVSSREVAEIQSAMTIAQARPRDEKAAIDRIMTACARPGLAERAVYQYARGGTSITGPSIRLAEAMIREWGNAMCGIRELEQRPGESTVEAFAWDLQTGTKHTMTFQVKHKRHTRGGGYALEDPRDIYELVANNGSRRLRACMLKLLPADIVDGAVEACAATLRASVDVTPELLEKLTTNFEKFDISKEQLESRIQRRLGSITPGLVLQLRHIYTSLEDGMSAPGDWFDPIKTEGEDEPTKAADIAKAKLKKDELDKKRAENDKAVNGDKGEPEPETQVSESDDAARQEWLAAMPDLLGKLDDKERKQAVTKYLGGNVETATLEQLRDCAGRLEKL
ncbi:MAG: hypothetical protein ACPG77_05955 [Nannocystaceae bacterium]